MEVRIREDKVEIEGYVNSVERLSKPLMSRIGQFLERICSGAFKKALKRNDDVHILLNHDWNRDLGSTKKGNLELEEDNIGLKARACISDPDVVKKARNGDLVGWSFGFSDRDVENTQERGLPTRNVKDLDLYEVSLLDRTKSPAYEGTLVATRDDDKQMFISDNFVDEINVREENAQKNENIVQNEVQKEENAQPLTEEPKVEEEPKQQNVVKNIDYSKYDEMIKEMKEE